MDDLLRDDAANSTVKVRARRVAAVMRVIRSLDGQAWHATQGGPFQFARWLAALTTVLTDWILRGTPQEPMDYLPVLVVVALLLLPDARSIGIAGLRFDRLTREMDNQKKDVDKLSAEVSSINNSLIAGSQVNVVLGTTVPGAAVLAAAVPQQAVPASVVQAAVSGPGGGAIAAPAGTSCSCQGPSGSPRAKSSRDEAIPGDDDRTGVQLRRSRRCHRLRPPQETGR